MNLPNDQEWIGLLSTGGIIGMFATFFVRYLSRSFHMERLETQKDEAAATLYQVLKAQIEDMEKRLQALAEEIGMLKRRANDRQRLILRIYKVIQGKCLSKDCPAGAELNTLLEEVITDDPQRRETDRPK